MRLLIVGGLQGQLGLATKIAMDKGAKVTHATDIEQALATDSPEASLRRRQASQRFTSQDRARRAFELLTQTGGQSLCS